MPEYKMTMYETQVTTFEVVINAADEQAARIMAERGEAKSPKQLSQRLERVVDLPSLEQLPEPSEAEEVPTMLYERAEAEIRQLLEKQAAVVSGRQAQRKADAVAGKIAEIEEGRLPDLCSPFTLSVVLLTAQASDSDKMRRDEIQMEGQVVYSADYDRVYFLAATRPNNGSTRTGRIIESGQEGEEFTQFFMGAIEFHLWNLVKDAAKQRCELSPFLSIGASHDVVLEGTDPLSLPEVIDLEEWTRRHEGAAPTPM